MNDNKLVMSPYNKRHVMVHPIKNMKNTDELLHGFMSGDYLKTFLNQNFQKLERNLFYTCDHIKIMVLSKSLVVYIVKYLS
jgi:hypothetical protein